MRPTWIGGSDLQTNAAARFVLTAVGVSLRSPKDLFERSLAADKHLIARSVRLLNCPSSRLHPPLRTTPCPPLNMGLDSSLNYLARTNVMASLRSLSPALVFHQVIRWAGSDCGAGIIFLEFDVGRELRNRDGGDSTAENPP